MFLLINSFFVLLAQSQRLTEINLTQIILSRRHRERRGFIFFILYVSL